MEKVVIFIKEFEGIIGAILGVMVTLITTDYLARKGKLELFLTEKKVIYKENSFIENEEEVLRRDYDGSFKIDYTLEVYNGTDINKIMRDFKIVFKECNKEVYSLVPKDSDTGRVSGGLYFKNNQSVVNVFPKQIIVLKHTLHIDGWDLKHIKSANQIDLIFKNEKNKNIKINIINDANITSLTGDK